MTVLPPPSITRAELNEDGSHPFLQAMDNIPLFMTHQPDQEEMKENQVLEALSALVHDVNYEGITNHTSPSHNMHKTKNINQANVKFGDGKYNEALKLYNQAMRLKLEISKELTATILLNRSAAHLQLKNHGWAVRDCIDVLKLDPTNVKAYYRAAKACIELDKADYANGFNEKALELQVNNKVLICQRDEIRKLQVQAEKMRNLSLQSKAKDAEAKENMIQNLKARGINCVYDKKLNPLFCPPTSDNDVTITVEDNQLMIPTTLLYPLYGQSDFIPDFHEASSLADVLDMVFAERAPWDTRNIYQRDELEMYYETSDHTTEQAPLDIPLLDLLTRKDFVLRGGQCAFVVLPRGKQYKNEWIQRIVGR